MKIDFDREKDRINCVARGVSLAEAANLDWETAIFWLDTRQDYGEDRYVALGYLCALVLRGLHGSSGCAAHHQSAQGQFAGGKRYAQTQTWPH